MEEANCHFSLWGPSIRGVSGPLVRPRLTLMGELKRGPSRDPTDNLGANLIEGQDFFSQSGARDKAWHAPDDAAGLVLDDDRGAGRAERFAPFQSILSHAGQDHAQGIRAIDCGDRSEEHVHRWPAEIFARPLVRRQHLAVFFFPYLHVIVAGGNPDTRRVKQVSRLTFPHRQGALRRGLFCHENRKYSRHMLCNDNGKQKSRGKGGQEYAEGVRASGRFPDGNNSKPGGARGSWPDPRRGLFYSGN
jgi:hypothetical protein